MSQLRSRRHWRLNGQHSILLEYASLKVTCPEGIYLCLTPDDPARWTGVLFVRKGPYAPAVLRFYILFPLQYPVSPPTIILTSDIFHPLVTPLTTYTYTTGSLASDPVSATDEERLPSGGFNLRHGFPQWFCKVEKSSNTSASSPKNPTGLNEPRRHQDDIETSPQRAFPGHVSANADPLEFTHSRWHDEYPSISEVLRYFKTAFDDVQIMDNLPLEVAGNPGAWKAWRAYRNPPQKSMNSQSRQPDEWNWSGVWKERVQKGINTSTSDSILYGSAGSGVDIIQFIENEKGSVDEILDNIHQ